MLLAMKALYPQFQVLLDKVDDEKIDSFITYVKSLIDYIENGDTPEALKG